MKWSLSEIKKHAKTRAQMNIDDLMETCPNCGLLKFSCSCNDLWIPLELLTNQENELHEILKDAQKGIDDKRTYEIVRAVCRERKLFAEEVLGDVP